MTKSDGAFMWVLKIHSISKANAALQLALMPCCLTTDAHMVPAIGLRDVVAKSLWHWLWNQEAIQSKHKKG